MCVPVSHFLLTLQNYSNLLSIDFASFSKLESCYMSFDIFRKEICINQTMIWFMLLFFKFDDELQINAFVCLTLSSLFTILHLYHHCSADHHDLV